MNNKGAFMRNIILISLISIAIISSIIINDKIQKSPDNWDFHVGVLTKVVEGKNVKCDAMILEHMGFGYYRVALSGCPSYEIKTNTWTSDYGTPIIKGTSLRAQNYVSYFHGEPSFSPVYGAGHDDGMPQHQRVYRFKGQWMVSSSFDLERVFVPKEAITNN